MKLFLVHCGFYDSEIGDGIYESHANYFVVAESFEAARTRAKLLPEFIGKRMHIDGLQEIEAVDGYRMSLIEDRNLAGQTKLNNVKHRELAAKPLALPTI